MGTHRKAFKPVCKRSRARERNKYPHMLFSERRVGNLSLPSPYLTWSSEIQVLVNLISTYFTRLLQKFVELCLPESWHFCLGIVWTEYRLFSFGWYLVPCWTTYLNEVSQPALLVSLLSLTVSGVFSSYICDLYSQWGEAMLDELLVCVFSSKLGLHELCVQSWQTTSSGEWALLLNKLHCNLFSLI